MYYKIVNNYRYHNVKIFIMIRFKPISRKIKKETRSLINLELVWYCLPTCLLNPMSFKRFNLKFENIFFISFHFWIGSHSLRMQSRSSFQRHNNIIRSLKLSRGPWAITSEGKWSKSENEFRSVRWERQRRRCLLATMRWQVWYFPFFIG